MAVYYGKTENKCSCVEQKLNNVNDKKHSVPAQCQSAELDGCSFNSK